MTDPTHHLRYPRKQPARSMIRLTGRALLPLLFKLEITGRENFPRQGPLLVVGNHTAAMEAVLLNIYSPWQIEMLSAADTPAERITEIVADLYGVIPLHRGSYDRAALSSALDVLSQNGVVGLFPEGGIWEEGKKKALPGIAWLSYRSGAAVLPVGFGDTSGAMNAGLKFRRPKLSMHVGKLLEPAKLPANTARKIYLQDYADRVMEAVHQLVPQEEYKSEPEIVNERIDLTINVVNREGTTLPIPEALAIQEGRALAKLLHRPAILKIFRVNLELPVGPLENLADYPTVEDLIPACQAILDYLDNDNPYLLTYRFGVREGGAMKQGLSQLRDLLVWCREHNRQIEIEATRKYYSLKEGHEVVQTGQDIFQSWM
jgi:1-acyl-sn-glycerol-3-phosphate acyltransferase